MTAQKNNPKLLLRTACCLGICLLFSAGTALAQHVMELKQGTTLERSLSTQGAIPALPDDVFARRRAALLTELGQT